ncbi:helix-turn-helix domain-containing protein [Marinobacter zhejiangensis]|uniref:AraC-type DNA-binding protein n=1 Tax=Marinobacter zhejiangensis TaxID=488535 RepID=A0A1I4PWC0_9GAMM|nr:AraC family transcriptional regulator [Marinobacter zhejiangensis]SFM32111.1 AraC-type DNA-binding protein [Marinobacter zhejiangensis]
MSHLSIANVWVNALLRTLHKLGLDVNRIVAGLPGFERGALSHRGRLDLISARQLWHNAARMSQDPLLGARIGLLQDYRSIGVLAPLLWHCPSVSLALQHVATYQTLISENGVFHYDKPLVENGTAPLLRCRYQETPAALAANPQQILSVVAGTIQYIRNLFDQQLVVLNLIIPNTLALDSGGLGNLLELPVATSDDHFGFDLDITHIDTPITGCDDTLYQLSLNYARQVLNAKQAGSEQLLRIRGYIARHGFALAGLDQCAKALDLHPRNLQRQLSDQGTSFRQLKEEVLKEVTIRELNQRTSPERISELLGYSEKSAFYRAFRSWFGVSPRQLARHTYLTWQVDVADKAQLRGADRF